MGRRVYENDWVGVKNVGLYYLRRGIVGDSGKRDVNRITIGLERRQGDKKEGRGDKNEGMKCKESRNSGLQFKLNAVQKSLVKSVLNNGLIPSSKLPLNCKYECPVSSLIAVCQ